MDGQDPNRRGCNDPSYTNQETPFGASQNTRGNSFDVSPGNRLSQQRPNPVASAGRPDASSLQQSFGNLGDASSTPVTNTLNHSDYQYNNYAPAGLSGQQSSQSYYNPPPFTAAPPYRAVQPSLHNPSSYDPPQQYIQRQPIEMLQQDDFGYDLGHAQPELPIPIPFQLPPVPTSYAPGRAVAALPVAQEPQPPQPPPSPEQPALLAGPAILNRSHFEEELERVYAHLVPITQVINSNGDLNRASNMLLRKSERFLSAVEQMGMFILHVWIIYLLIYIGLTLDIPEQEERGYQLWRNFNIAWLALFQNQYQRSYDLQRAGSSLNQPGLMSQQVIYSVISQLSELAREHVEDRGLLDYEWGLWETDITRSGSSFSP